MTVRTERGSIPPEDLEDLLRYLAVAGTATIDDVATEFNVTSDTALQMLNALRSRGEVLELPGCCYKLTKTPETGSVKPLNRGSKAVPLRSGDVRWGKLTEFQANQDGTITVQVGRFRLIMDDALLPKTQRLVGRSVIVARANGRDGIGYFAGWKT